MTMSSTLSRNFPTLKHVVAPFRWLFGSRQRVLTMAAVLAAMLAAPVLWWMIQLVGLPDIGEPFDAQGLWSLTIPDDRNAFVLYRRAAELLRPPRGKFGFVDRWSKADPAFRRWSEENRKALDLYRRGSERPDALDIGPPEGPASLRSRSALRSFFFMALLEASRLEEGGDMAGAWTWYRAALRATYHQGLRNSVMMRSVNHNWLDILRGRLAAWAADSRTTPADLRRSLEDLVACEELLPSDAYTLRWEYPAMERMLEGPENPGRGEPYMRIGMLVRSWPIRPTPEQIARLGEAWRWWRREPERSRRVLRLAVANWLAYYELPRRRRPKPDPQAAGPVPFYAFGPEAPEKARAVSPAELSRWLGSTMDADGLLRSWGFLWSLRRVQLQDQAHYRAILLLVAGELYRRERGADPPSDEAMVGVYLRDIPFDEPPADLGMGPSARK